MTDDRIRQIVERDTPDKMLIAPDGRPGDFFIVFARLVEREVLMEAAEIISKSYFFELPDTPDDGRVHKVTISLWLTEWAKRAEAST